MQLMWSWFKRFAKENRRPAAAAYLVTYRMQTGAGQRQLNSREEVAAFLDELRDAGASDITVADGEGNLVSFEPGR